MEVGIQYWLHQQYTFYRLPVATNQAWSWTIVCIEMPSFTLTMSMSWASYSNFAANWADIQSHIHLANSKIFCKQWNSTTRWRTRIWNDGSLTWIAEILKRERERLRSHFATNKQTATATAVVPTSSGTFPTRSPSAPMFTPRIRRDKRPLIRCQVSFSKKASRRWC